VSDEEDAKKVPTTRIGRAAVVGRLAASTSVKQMGTRAANVARSDEAATKALERRQVETAEQIVAALGTMKGAAMKLGQVLSFLDVGLVPEEYREEFQKKLAKLRDAAPKVSFKDMRKVIEAESARSSTRSSPSSTSRRSRPPRSARSTARGCTTGATSRSRSSTPASRRRPRGHAEPRADHAPGEAHRARGSTPRRCRRRSPSASIEELDYELEASNQRRLARIFRGHPFIVVPEVVTDSRRERVIVTEFVTVGASRRSARRRHRRSATGSARSSSASTSVHVPPPPVLRRPAPRQLPRLGDGRCCFLDFGLFKVISKEAAEIELQSIRYVMEGDGPALVQLFGDNGFLNDPSRMDPDRLLDSPDLASWWYTEDEVLTLTPEIATQVMIEMGDPRSSTSRGCATSLCRPSTSSAGAWRADARRPRPAARDR
jgi:hypothetical protein